jgi:ubiquitin-protein ligase
MSFPEFNYTLIKDRLCDSKTFQRILKEAQDTNDDFKTLRTVITPTDTIGVLHFVQYPADGALTDKPIFGRVIVTKYYPTEAPVVHIFTKTDRYNVDIFNSSCYNLTSLHSSACFDILNAGYGGTWKPDFTISALLASLLQAIVSVSVPQQHGSDVKEFVTMEKLDKLDKNVFYTYNKYKAYIPAGRIIEKVQGTSVDTRSFKFPKKFTDTRGKFESFLWSDPFTLEDIRDNGPLSIGIDLFDLKNNKSTVFSVVMTSTQGDLVGKDPNTILFRNGVTGTAAVKEKKKSTVWFYHGVPLNDDNSEIIVTVTSNQFVMNYKKDNNFFIHGDYPVAYFRDPSLLKIPFRLCIYLKNKNNGIPVSVNLKEHKQTFIQNTDDFELL